MRRCLRFPAFLAGVLMAGAVTSTSNATGERAVSLNPASSCFDPVLTWGEFGVGPAKFYGVMDIAIDDEGDVYVLDGRGDRIQRFTGNGSYLLDISIYPETSRADPEEVPGATDGVLGIAIHEGHLFVCHREAISILALTGEKVGQLDVDVVMQGFTMAPDGTFFVRTEGARIVRLGLVGEILDGWELANSLPSPSTGGYLLGASPTGDLYVADPVRRRVQRYSSSGDFLGEWGERGREPGQVGMAGGLGFLPDGRVLFGDSENHRVTVFSAAGDYICDFGEPGQEPGQFNRPCKMAVGRLGIYICDAMNVRVQLFRATDRRTRASVWPAVRRWLKTDGATTEAGADTVPPISLVPTIHTSR